MGQKQATPHVPAWQQHSSQYPRPTAPPYHEYVQRTQVRAWLDASTSSTPVTNGASCNSADGSDSELAPIRAPAVSSETAAARTELGRQAGLPAGGNDLSRSTLLSQPQASDLGVSNQNVTMATGRGQENTRSLYPVLSGAEQMGRDVFVSTQAQSNGREWNKACEKSVYKNTAKSAVSGVSSNNRRQNNRNRRKPLRITGNQNIRPMDVSNFVSRHVKDPPSDSTNNADNDLNFSKNETESKERQKKQFSEEVMKGNVEVMLRMLNDMSLEGSSDATKLLLKKLYSKLADLHATAHAAPGRGVSSERSESSDGDSEEEGAAGPVKPSTQHVFGDVYFCTVCEQDLQGKAAASRHECGAVPASDEPMNTTIMWREVNRAQKGRWYNISRQSDGSFLCTTCGVGVESARQVTQHVWQNYHQQELARRRAEETPEQRLWREVPSKWKFNKKFFVVIGEGDGSVLVCNLCLCEVPLSCKSLVAHVMAEVHAQRVRDARRN
ncbi:uncharacterized protein LOC134530048 [Bacillus rossius redtenbacheri]|uniref:uncharacterized protein LOC134530048 n=1 Tax=Bacillus rossius redtenbacheri TaxID=93214 RepID=UPI002FDE7A69